MPSTLLRVKKKTNKNVFLFFFCFQFGSCIEVTLNLLDTLFTEFTLSVSVVQTAFSSPFVILTKKPNFTECASIDGNMKIRTTSGLVAMLSTINLQLIYFPSFGH